MRRYISIFLSLLLTGALVSPATAAEIWQPSYTVGDNVGLTLSETWGNETSFIVAMTDRGENKLPDQKLCLRGYGPYPCNFAANGKEVWGTILFPSCTSKSEFNCIEDVSIWKSTGSKKSASFVRQVEGATIPADKSHNLTKGSTVSIWSAADAPHMGGASTYGAYVKLGVGFSDGKFIYNGLHATLVPFLETPMPGAEPIVPKQLKNPEGFTEVAPGGFDDTRCVYAETDLCGARQDFTPDTKASMRLRLTKDIIGWFSGRMKDPTIKVTSIDAKANLVEVTASSVKVPKIDAVLAKAEMSSSLNNYYKKEYVNQPKSDWRPINILSNSPGAPSAIELFRKSAKDTVAGYNSYWSFTTAEIEGQKAYTCLTSYSRLQGIISTDSMAYQGGVPKFSGGFLNYVVAGLHYEPDGTTPVLGSYDLVMRSDIARCLYGFSQAPLSATVSVINDTGAKTTATTVVSEKNGWLKLAAYGFTFSKKTIKIKITKKVVKKN